MIGLLFAWALVRAVKRDLLPTARVQTPRVADNAKGAEATRRAAGRRCRCRAACGARRRGRPVMPTMMPATAAPLPARRAAGDAAGLALRDRRARSRAAAWAASSRRPTPCSAARSRSRKRSSRDPEALRRFQRETRITARLEHPSIVPVHDAGISPSGAPFYVMRKIGGRPLEELVGRAADARRTGSRCVPHIVAAAQAIAHAHERGIVHRDIKPSNILVGELGETIVIDWGLAKAIGEADEIRAGAIAGQPVDR